MPEDTDEFENNDLEMNNFPPQEERDEETNSQSGSKYQVSTESSAGSITSVVGDNPHVTINYYIELVKGIESNSEAFLSEKKDSKHTDERKDQSLEANLAFEWQNATYFKGNVSETKIDVSDLPDGNRELANWYYKLDLYEQCYVQAASILHGAPAHDVSMRADTLYEIFHINTYQNDNTQLVKSSGEEPKSAWQFISSSIAMKPGWQLQLETLTMTRRFNGVERVFWQDADLYGLSDFGLLVLTFLANEFLNKGQQGQAFLNIVREWSEEQKGECPQRAAHALGVILWYQNIHQLRGKADEWAKHGSLFRRRRAASFLDGAYEIERIKNEGQARNLDESFVLRILNEWIEKVHSSLANKEMLGPTYMRLGCATANSYSLIGKREPETALQGLKYLLKLPLSKDTEEIHAIYAAGVSTYVSLTWAGHIRDVLKNLASNAEELSHEWKLPLGIEARRGYRQQREVRLRANFEAFFLIAAAATPNAREINSFSYKEELPSQIAIPDQLNRDILLTAILTGDDLRASILTLLCSAVISVHSKSAFDLIYRWVQAVSSIHNEDGPVFSASLSDFLIELGQMISNWCVDLSLQGYRVLSAKEIYRKRLEHWQIKGHIKTYPVEMFMEKILQQLGN